MPEVRTIEEPTLEPYNIEQERERIRSIIAIVLIALIVCEMFGIGIVGVWAILQPEGRYGCGQGSLCD